MSRLVFAVAAVLFVSAAGVKADARRLSNRQGQLTHPTGGPQSGGVRQRAGGVLAAAIQASGDQESAERRAVLLSAARAIMQASPHAALITVDAKGRAREQHWQRQWDAFYARRSDALLIEVVPEQLEVVDIARGIEGNPETWQPPTVRFGADSPH
jgi:hypothetical protein